MNAQSSVFPAAIGVTVMLVFAPLPVSNVSAHACRTPLTIHPSDPTNADTGCDGASCPANSGTLPHEHENWLEDKRCRNHAKRFGQGWGQGGRPGPPGFAPLAAENCPHQSAHAHNYAFSGSETVVGIVTVWDGNTMDCDGDGIGGDFDGDYDSGIGGAFFGYGPWAHEPTCNYGLTMHGGSVTVHDFVFGPNVWFTIGAADTSGPVISVDPVTGETTCSTDGGITPGDPSVDPTVDADDCLTESRLGAGTTCGAGGDGGYWVFLERWTFDEPPTTGTITA